MSKSVKCIKVVISWIYLASHSFANSAILQLTEIYKNFSYVIKHLPWCLSQGNAHYSVVQGQAYLVLLTKCLLSGKVI